MTQRPCRVGDTVMFGKSKMEVKLIRPWAVRSLRSHAMLWNSQSPAAVSAARQCRVSVGVSGMNKE